jgi:hypothetical protein
VPTIGTRPPALSRGDAVGVAGSLHGHTSQTFWFATGARDGVPGHVEPAAAAVGALDAEVAVALQVAAAAALAGPLGRTSPAW